MGLIPPHSLFVCILDVQKQRARLERKNSHVTCQHSQLTNVFSFPDTPTPATGRPCHPPSPSTYCCSSSSCCHNHAQPPSLLRLQRLHHHRHNRARVSSAAGPRTPPSRRTSNRSPRPAPRSTTGGLGRRGLPRLLPRRGSGDHRQLLLSIRAGASSACRCPWAKARGRTGRGGMRCGRGGCTRGRRTRVRARVHARVIKESC